MKIRCCGFDLNQHKKRSKTKCLQLLLLYLLANALNKVVATGLCTLPQNSATRKPKEKHTVVQLDYMIVVTHFLFSYKHPHFQFLVWETPRKTYFS